MKPIHKTWTMAVADDNVICTSQKPTGAGYFSIDGALSTVEMDTTQLPSVEVAVAKLDVYRRVAITSDADERTATFTFTGTDPAGTVFSESITGPNATTVVSLNGFVKVLSVHISKAAAGNVIVGTCDQADTPWHPVSYYGPRPGITLQAKYSTGASLTWQWQSSSSNPQDGSTAASKFASAEGSALTASGVVEVVDAPVLMVRGKITSYVGGSVDYSIVKTTGD
jgi:hypothetical protein